MTIATQASTETHHDPAADASNSEAVVESPASSVKESFVDVTEKEQPSADAAGSAEIDAKSSKSPSPFDEDEIAKELLPRLDIPEIAALLPAGLKIVPAGPQFIDNYLRFIRAANDFYQQDWVVTREDLEHQFIAPTRKETDRYVLLDATTDEVIASGGNFLREPTGASHSTLSMDPRHPRHLEIKEALIKINEKLIMTKADRVPEDKPISVIVGQNDKANDVIKVVESLEYEYKRSWYLMSIDLSEKKGFPEASFPANLELRPYKREAHAHALHTAQNEAFRDHSGHAEDIPFERWDFYMHGIDFKEELFYLLWDGDEIAAAILVDDESRTKPGHVHLGIVFCRRPWRKQGVATNMLRYVLSDVQKKGFVRAELGVDSKSKTNAVALYERAGMYKKKEHLTFRKVLRGNPEDVVD